MTNASGLAASIRGSVESSTFDLAGQNVSTITSNITSAFQDPLPLSDMIRITFITGAGKLGRQKYDADAAKTVTSTLRDLGFDEDRGASCVKECAGFFKMQHDTGKNLKTVVVFPKISGDDDEMGQGDSSSPDQSGGSPVFVRGSVEDMIASSSTNVFEGMIKSKCPSWSEKKACMTRITGIKTKVTELEQKLMTGTPLTDEEQDFYDSVSADSLEKKQNMVKEMMHHQVDEGKINSREKSQLLLQVNERLETVSKEITGAIAKKAEKLKAVKQKVEARKAKLSDISPQQPYKLKHEAAILALRKDLQPLLELENGAGGRLLSLKETKSLARKDEILEEIAELEANSRGWFEDDESFELRVNACNASWSTKSKQNSTKGGKKSNPPPKTSTSAWMTSTTTRTKGAKSKSTTKSFSKKGKGSGGVFAAMIMDSDSD